MWVNLQRAYRRLRFGEPVIVVSGLPRSGTSMTMKMLEAAGLTPVVDGIREADEDNPKGYYEDERVKDLGGDGVDKTWLRGARGKVVKIISYLIKDLPEENNYKVLFMRRNLDEVLRSQQKMLERRGEPNETSDEQMKEIYESHLWRIGYLVQRARHLEVLDVDYKAVLDRPRDEAQRIAEFLGLALDAGKMSAVVDRQLYRNRAS